MELVLCDISAWQYWRTPPLLRDSPLDPGRVLDALGGGEAKLIMDAGHRLNARPAERSLSNRLFTDLKGLTLPVHIATDAGMGLRHSDVVCMHRLPVNLPREWLVDLGGGLKVYSPELTCVVHACPKSAVAICKMMYEACGIFSLLPASPRLSLAVQDLRSQGVLAPGIDWGAPILGHADTAGRPLGFLDAQGEALQWRPWFDRTGKLSDLWKRPPLTSAEQMNFLLGELKGVKGTKRARKAAEALIDGAASPAEVQACLLLCASIWMGGEGWPAPVLNMRIDYSAEAATLASKNFCIADCLWRNEKKILEVNGVSAHDNEFSYRLEQGRKAALESMGYTVADLMPSQMTDLSCFDVMLPLLAEKLSMPLARKTAAFLRRRDTLHHELFALPYDPL